MINYKNLIYVNINQKNFLKLIKIFVFFQMTSIFIPVSIIVLYIYMFYIFYMLFYYVQLFMTSSPTLGQCLQTSVGEAYIESTGTINITVRIQLF